MQIVVDGILTHYQIIGNKPKTLLILPGWMRSLEEWLPTAKQLSDNYKVILIDLPGFGKTPRPQTAYSIYNYAAFVEHFLDKLEVNKITLLGHSFAARIGIILGNKTDKVTKLILIDAAGVEKKNNLTKIKNNLFKLAKVIMPKQFQEKLRDKLGSQDYKTAGVMRDIFVKVVNVDLTYMMPKISAPTLLIWGNNDTEVQEWKTKLMSKLIPSARLRIVWSAFHSPHLEKPTEFMEILKE